MMERRIEEAIASHDLWKLRELALSDGGLLNDSLRRQAYRVLLPEDVFWDTASSLTEKDRQSVRWDVERCDLSPSDKEVLVDVIERSCRHYYQGYHLIAKTIVRIFQNDTNASIYILRRLYTMHLGQFVAHDDLPIVRLVQLMGLPMLCAFDYDLYQVMDEYTCSVRWILTWFSTHNESSAPRLFDALIASHTLLPLYMSFALLIQHKHLILQDPMNAHKPLQILNADALIHSAVDLMARIPPNQRLWMVTSHYYGDGAVEDLLSTAASNSLLRLATPECCDMTPQHSPRASIAAGMGKPKPHTYQRLAASCVAVLATLYWAVRTMVTMLVQQPKSPSPPPPPLMDEGLGE